MAITAVKNVITQEISDSHGISRKGETHRENLHSVTNCSYKIIILCKVILPPKMLLLMPIFRVTREKQSH